MERLHFFWSATLLVTAVLFNLRSSGAEKITDAESATHGFEAASYQVVDTYQFAGFKVVQFELGVLSHYSYLLVSGKEAWVVDPGRDTNAYLEAAEGRCHDHGRVAVSFARGFRGWARRVGNAAEDPHLRQREDGSRLSRETAQGG